jgi:hypothetical protein
LLTHSGSTPPALQNLAGIAFVNPDVSPGA